MEILFAAGHLPACCGRQAGQKTSYHICEFLARRHQLHFLGFIPADEIAELNQADMEMFASWELTPVTSRVRVIGALSAPLLPLSIAARHSHGFRRRLQKIVRERQPDVVIFDHTAMFQYAAGVPASVVTVGSAHDMMTQSWQRKKSQSANPVSRLLLSAEFRRMERWEKTAWARLDLVVAHNGKDKQLVETLEPRARVIAIDAWMSPPACYPASHREPGAMIFWGAMDRPENVDAARWAAREIVPSIRRSVPRAKLYIAGSRGEQLAPEFAGRDDIVVTGFVEDVGALMSRMEIALLPLRLGAGIKIKTLECMAAGLPVVTTSVGAEGVNGIHGTHYQVADAAEKIAAHAIEFLSDPSAAREMGARAKQFIAESRDFAARMSSFEEVLVDVVAERRNGQKR